MSGVRRLAVALAVAALAAGCGDDAADRRAGVAERGAEVMPFDLDRTTHTFTKTGDGGVQLVTADDPGDEEQVARIRSHLFRLRDGFRRGDFDDPASIHGADMAGLDRLRAGHERIDVTFREVAGGAELRYRSDDPDLVAALHAWFDQQVGDHGDHAEAG